MRSALSCLLAWLFLACGGTAVIDGDDGGDDGGGAGDPANECDGQPCGAPCHIGPYQGPATGVCTSDEQCAYDTTCAGPCDGKLCGDTCVVCNDIECLEGFCGNFGACAPEAPVCG